MYQAGLTHNAVLKDDFPSVRWTLTLPKKINGGLAYDGVRLYVDDFAKELLALDPQTGKVRWRAAADDVLMSTPVVADGRVFVGSGTNAIMWDTRQETLWGKPAGNHVFAFDARNGRELWKFKTRGEAMPSPAYENGRLFFGDGAGIARAVDARTGRLIWQASLPGIVTMGGVMPLDSNVLFMASRGAHWVGAPQRNHTLLMSAATGRVVWKRPFGNSDCTPTVANGTVFIESSEDHGNMRGLNRVRALNAKTGALRWTYQSKMGVFTLKGSNERAIAGMYDRGTLYQSIPVVNKFAAFDARTGKIRWMNATSAPVKMSAVEDSGKVYYGDTNGMFYVVDAKSGHILYKRRFAKGFTTSSPIILGHTMFVATTNELHAIPLADLH